MVLFGANTFAGNEKGNGGGIHYCAGQKTQELYDIYEGQARYGYIIKPSSLSVDEQINNTIGKIKKANPYIARNFEEQIKYLKNGHMLLRAKVKLTPIIDDANILLVDEGCAYKQLANWDEVSGNLLVNKDYFDRMNNLNKAAFYTHEALYKVGRDLDLLPIEQDGNTTSDTVRRMVGEIFSTNEALDSLWTYNLDKIKEENKKQEEEERKYREEIVNKYQPAKIKYNESFAKFAAIKESELINKCSSVYIASRRVVTDSLILYRNAVSFVADDIRTIGQDRDIRLDLLLLSSQLTTVLGIFEMESYGLAESCKKR
jgi:hypothetical protein